MRVRFVTRAILLIVAGLAGVTVEPVSAQTVSAERRFHAEPSASGHHLLSLPWAGGPEDVANSALPDPCDLDGASADGVLNADDLICTIWGAGVLDDRTGLISVGDLHGTCRETARTAFRPTAGAAPIFVGTPFDYRPEAGFLVSNVALPGQPAPDDLVTFEGPCEPTLPARDLSLACGPQYLNLPYDTALRTIDEVLCGLEGLDWRDDDGNGAPDTCTGGLFDASRGVAITVAVTQNPWDLEDRGEPAAHAGLYGRTVFSIFGGQPSFVGVDRDLRPGDGLLVSVGEGAPETIWLPPVEGCD